MFNPKGTMLVLQVVALTILIPRVLAQETKPSEAEGMYYRYLEFASYVKGGQ